MNISATPKKFYFFVVLNLKLNNFNDLEFYRHEIHFKIVWFFFSKL